MKSQQNPDISKLLGITDDLMFQNVIKDSVNCRMFLHEVSPDLDIHNLTVCAQERSAFNKEEKFSVLDVLVKDSQGRRHDIAMQVAPQKDLDKRARYYMFDMNPEIRTRISGFFLCPNYLNKTKLIFIMIGNITINHYAN